ncbi:MAG: acetylornithine deacetylase [Geminicoccaceae bacterium]
MSSATADLLERLIAFPSISDRSNLPIADFVEDYLAGLGVTAHRVPSPDGQKAAVLATVGPADRPGIVLSGHMDVVPTEGQAWTNDPFTTWRKDGRLYGRGSADMKGFLASAMTLVPTLQKMGLTAPVTLAFSYDEEIGCLGVPHLLDAMADLLPKRPWGCLVGEPTLMQPVDAHKGKAAARCTVTGRPGHSALTDRAVNAVAIAAEIVCHVQSLGERMRREGPHAHGFDPCWTTSSIGRIEGGGQLNVIPAACTFEFEFRSIPGVEAKALVADVEAWALSTLLPGMREIAPEADIRFEAIQAYPGLAADPADRFLQLCRELAGGAEAGKVAFGTEAGWYQSRQIPSVVLGPGDIRVAHKPDEYIEQSQLDACDAFLERLVRAACT